MRSKFDFKKIMKIDNLYQDHTICWAEGELKTLTDLLSDLLLEGDDSKFDNYMEKYRSCEPSLIEGASDERTAQIIKSMSEGDVIYKLVGRI